MSEDLKKCNCDKRNEFYTESTVTHVETVKCQCGKTIGWIGKDTRATDPTPDASNKGV